jgi:hypothetical protein
MKKLDQTVIFLLLTTANRRHPKEITTKTKFTDLKTSLAEDPKKTQARKILLACLLPSSSFLACFLPWVWLFLARSSSACFC